jgi:hypothetical protein
MISEILKHASNIKLTVPLVALVGLVVLGFKADDLTVGYLDEWFFSEAQAQGLSSKVGEIESKVDDIGLKVDANRIATIEREIFRLRIESCMAVGALKTVYADQTAQLVAEWRRLTGSAGNPSTYVNCEDLG